MQLSNSTEISCISFIDKSNTIILGTISGDLIIVDYKRRKILKKLDGAHKNKIKFVAPIDCKIFLSISNDNSL